jgi:hypothetical protein
VPSRVAASGRDTEWPLAAWPNRPVPLDLADNPIWRGLQITGTLIGHSEFRPVFQDWAEGRANFTARSRLAEQDYPRRRLHGRLRKFMGGPFAVRLGLVTRTQADGRSATSTTWSGFGDAPNPLFCITQEDIEITPLAGYWARQTVAISRVA